MSIATLLAIGTWLFTNSPVIIAAVVAVVNGVVALRQSIKKRDALKTAEEMKKTALGVVTSIKLLPDGPAYQTLKAINERIATQLGTQSSTLSKLVALAGELLVKANLGTKADETSVDKVIRASSAVKAYFDAPEGE
jgi:hypothetical protein